jgi:hypothetical protein
MTATSTRATHTPGSWQYEENHPNSIPAFTVYDTSGPHPAGSMLVAYLGHTRTPGQAEANARLISAAPELFAACKAFVESFCDHPDRDESSLGMAREAIAKVTNS